MFLILNRIESIDCMTGCVLLLFNVLFICELKSMILGVDGVQGQGKGQQLMGINREIRGEL